MHYQTLLRLKSRASPFEKSMIELAWAYVSNDAHAKIRALETGLRFAPGNRILLINLGWCRYRLRDYERALQAFEAVIESRMQYPPVFPPYARTLIRLGRQREARKALEECLVVTPVDPDTYSLLAAFRAAEGDASGAEQFETRYHERRGSLGDGWLDVYESMGDNLFDLHAYGKAAEYFRKAIITNPEKSRPHAKLAATLLAAHDTTGAILEGERALAIDQKSGEAHLALGAICEARENHRKAIEHYRSYLTVDSISITASEIQRRLTAIRESTVGIPGAPDAH